MRDRVYERLRIMGGEINKTKVLPYIHGNYMMACADGGSNSGDRK